MNAGSTPERVGYTHLADQPTNLDGQLRPAGSSRSRFPAPEGPCHDNGLALTQSASCALSRASGRTSRPSRYFTSVGFYPCQLRASKQTFRAAIAGCGVQKRRTRRTGSSPGLLLLAYVSRREEHLLGNEPPLSQYRATTGAPAP